ncbi:hypothetical protein WJX84_007102 [Apatococcus fuscideae]|uniref:Uncharacterized protein n=1 Tax=Apatococcus fuscideae TaxID=2026836 RepID=A0AAW1SZT7_9CHLO
MGWSLLEGQPSVPPVRPPISSRTKARMPQVLVVLPVLGFPWSADCFQTPVPVTACWLIAVQMLATRCGPLGRCRKLSIADCRDTAAPLPCGKLVQSGPLSCRNGFLGSSGPEVTVGIAALRSSGAAAAGPFLNDPFAAITAVSVAPV